MAVWHRLLGTYFSAHSISSKLLLALSSNVATMSEGMIVNPYITGGTFTQVNVNNITGLQGT